MYTSIHNVSWLYGETLTIGKCLYQMSTQKMLKNVKWKCVFVYVKKKSCSHGSSVSRMWIGGSLSNIIIIIYAIVELYTFQLGITHHPSFCSFSWNLKIHDHSCIVYQHQYIVWISWTKKLYILFVYFVVFLTLKAFQSL